MKSQPLLRLVLVVLGDFDFQEAVLIACFRSFQVTFWGEGDFSVKVTGVSLPVAERHLACWVVDLSFDDQNIANTFNIDLVYPGTWKLDNDEEVLVVFENIDPRLPNKCGLLKKRKEVRVSRRP